MKDRAVHAPPHPDAAKSDTKPFYSTSEVAELFGVTGETVRDWIASKRLEAVRLPSGHYRIPREVVVAFGSSTYEAGAKADTGQELFL